MKDEKKTKGRVKRTIVNHYPDGDTDTLIELEDGTKIVYSGDVPIPKGDEIISRRISTMAEVMARLHPQFFTITGEPKKPLDPKPSEYSFMFAMYSEVIDADEIYDETTGITYKER